MFTIPPDLFYVLGIEFIVFATAFFVSFFLLSFSLPKKFLYKVTPFKIVKTFGIVCGLFVFILLFIQFGIINRIVFGFSVVAILGLVYKLWKRRIPKQASYAIIIFISFLSSIVVITMQFYGNELLQIHNADTRLVFTKQMENQYSIRDLKGENIIELILTISVPRDGKYLVLVRAIDSATITNHSYDLNKYQDSGLIISGEPGWIDLKKGENEVVIRSHNNRSLYAVKSIDLEVSIQPEKPQTQLLITNNGFLSQLLLMPSSTIQIKEGMYYYSSNLECNQNLSLSCKELGILHYSRK